MTGSLSAQAEALASKVKEYEASKDSFSRAERLQLIQSMEKLTLQLKDPKEAIFDHLTNVMFSLPYWQPLSNPFVDIFLFFQFRKGTCGSNTCSNS